MGYYYILYDYVLQLLEMEKKKIVVLLGSLQAMIASVISAFTAIWKIKRKLKRKLKYINYLLFSKLNSQFFCSRT